MTPRCFSNLNEPNNAGGIGHKGREGGRLGPSLGARRPLRPGRGTMCARFDFGISPEVIRARMEPILSDARRIQRAGWGALPSGPALQECLARLRDLAPKTYQKTVARIAGVFVIHSYFRSRMTHEAIGQAISTSSFY